MTGLSLVFGFLIGFTVDVAKELVADRIKEFLQDKNLCQILEKCLKEVVQQHSAILAEACQELDGTTPAQPYFDRDGLRRVLQAQQTINPLTLTDSDTQWDVYFKPFLDVVVMPGCVLSLEEQIALVRRVVEHAQACFRAKVAQYQPAFNQYLMGVQESHTKEHVALCGQHADILRAIEDVPARTVEQLSIDLDGASRSGSSSSAESNPFAVVAADALQLENPGHVKQIRDLFVSRFTDMETIKKHFNTVLEGQRGTGKTMIMKYLAFQTQIYEWQESGNQGDEFLASDAGFIGVYIKLKSNVYDKFRIVQNSERRLRLFEHRLVLQVTHRVLSVMREVYEHHAPTPDGLARAVASLASFLRVDALASAPTGNPKLLLQTAMDHIDDNLVFDLDKHLGSIVPGGQETEYHPWLTLSGQLGPLLRRCLDSAQLQCPFFLLLDDFDVLSREQQEILLRAASERESAVVCYKFGTMISGFKGRIAGAGRTFRSGDDYDPINLDWTEGGLHENYAVALRDIAQARLGAVGWQIELDDLFERWSAGERILEEVRETMKAEWDSAPDDRKPTEARSDFLSKYSNARYFQEVRQRKIHMIYAGLDAVTMVSSGIFRQFLEVSKRIIDRARESGWAPGQGAISAPTQDEAIREYSESMMEELRQTAGGPQVLLQGDIDVTSRHMVTLIESFSDLFYSRLHTPDHREPEIICIAIRDADSASSATAYLDVAVRESILHPMSYSPKTPGGPRLKTYMLNRRLGPRRSLSIQRMQGRIEVDMSHIGLATTNRKLFVEAVIDAMPYDDGTERLELDFGQ